VVFTPDCSLNAILDRTNLFARITDTASGKQRLQFKLAEGTPEVSAFGASSFSPDGTRFATTGPGNTAKVYDISTPLGSGNEDGGREILTLDGHTALVMTVSFSPDGKQLATTSQDKSVKLWDAETGQELETFTGLANWGSRVVFSPDGKRLASGDWGGTAKVWDLETGQDLLTLAGAGASVWGLGFSPDGRLIASGSNDRTLRLWDAKTGEQLLTLPGAFPALQINFTPDSTMLVTSQPNGESRVYLPRIEDLYSLAQARVSRTLRPQECQEYLHLEQCPQD
jgi:WD40 repeat protein